MDKLRIPLFIVSLALALLIVLVEVGANWFPKGEVGSKEMIAKIDPVLAAEMGSLKQELKNDTPPGVGIPDMALLDGLMLFSVCLMGSSFLLTDRLIGRVQGVTTLIVSLLVLIFAIVKIFATILKVLLMIGLFTAVPFGTIAYMAIWGFFDRGGATVLLGLLLVLKLAFAVCLVLAHQRFLRNKGLVLMIITSLLANVIVTFLHGLVPVLLVSITDGIAGIVVLILVVIWAIVLLIGAIIAVIKAIA